MEDHDCEAMGGKGEGVDDTPCLLPTGLQVWLLDELEFNAFPVAKVLPESFSTPLQQCRPTFETISFRLDGQPSRSLSRIRENKNLK